MSISDFSKEEMAFITAKLLCFGIPRTGIQNLFNRYFTDKIETHSIVLHESAGTDSSNRTFILGHNT